MLQDEYPRIANRPPPVRLLNGDGERPHESENGKHEKTKSNKKSAPVRETNTLRNTTNRTWHACRRLLTH